MSAAVLGTPECSIEEGWGKLVIPISEEINGWECLTSPSIKLLGMGIGSIADPIASYLKRGGEIMGLTMPLA